MINESPAVERNMVFTNEALQFSIEFSDKIKINYRNYVTEEVIRLQRYFVDSDVKNMVKYLALRVSKLIFFQR